MPDEGTQEEVHRGRISAFLLEAACPERMTAGETTEIPGLRDDVQEPQQKDSGQKACLPAPASVSMKSPTR